jgi:hypothetical protein
MSPSLMAGVRQGEESGSGLGEGVTGQPIGKHPADDEVAGEHTACDAISLFKNYSSIENAPRIPHA